MGWVRPEFDSRYPDMIEINHTNKKSSPPFSALSLALKLGYIIAIPAVIFVLLGRLGDTYFGTSPLLLILGLLLALTASSLAVFQEIRKINL